ncbi:putative ribonuclease H-like domain-containing protein, partial [Tanacetum coccineum]
MNKPQHDDKGFVDSGCSRHMTGNIAYLSDFKEFDRGYVSFGGCAYGGRITGKGTLKSDNLDFEDNIVPKESLTCLLAKATLDESMLWHRRLGKQHRASCKSKVLNPITKPLFMLHMDLFGPTFDETSEILKNFIKEIENIVDLKVKIIRSDNGTEFKNKVMDDFCREKGIKREYSVARTPYQNGVAERRNKTLIKPAKTMLADSKLPTTFWAKVVSIACYVQNRVLVVKPHNKTPYKLFRGFKPALGFMRLFGCHVTILNTLDSLGKFDGKYDEGIISTEFADASYFDSPTKNVDKGEPKTADDAQKQVEDGLNDENAKQERFANDSSSKDVNAVGKQVNTAGLDLNTGSLELNDAGPSVSTASPYE